MRVPLAISVVLALARLAVAEEPAVVSFPAECYVLKLSSHGRFLVGSDYRPGAPGWIARLDNGKLVVDKALRQAQVSEDELFAAGMDDEGFIVVVDLKAGTQRRLSKLGPFLFSPKGHTLAFWSAQVEAEWLPGTEPAPAGYSIDLFDAATGSTTQLTQFIRDIPKGTTIPLRSLDLLQWADDAIRLVAHYGGGNGVAVKVDPATDVASTSSEERLWKRKLLADGSQIEAVPAEDMSLISYIQDPAHPQAPKVIFGHDLTGEAVCSLQYDFSSIANRMVVWSSNSAGDKQSFWAENLSTLKVHRIFEAPLDDRGTPPFDLSEDGGWVAYRDPKDSKKVVVVPVPDL